MKCVASKITDTKLHSGGLYSCIPWGKSIFTSGGDGLILEHLPDRETCIARARVGEQIFALEQLSEHILAFGHLKGGVHIVNLESKEEIQAIDLHQRAIYSMQFIPSRNELWVASGDGSISVWNWENEKLEFITPIPLSKESIRTLLVDESKALIYAGASDGKIYIISLVEKKCVQSIDANSPSVFSLANFELGNLLLSAGRDGKILFFDKQDMQLIHSIPAHKSTVNSIVVSPDGRFLASGSRDKTVRIWDLKSFALVKEIQTEREEGHFNSVNAVCWADRKTLISCGDDRRVIFWNITIEEE